MTKAEILFNYDQAKKQAAKLDKIAKQLETLSSNKMNDTLGILKNAWQSDSSSQYYGKVGKVQDDIKTTANKIRKIANAVRTTAEAVKKSEMRALEIAKARSYT